MPVRKSTRPPKTAAFLPVRNKLEDATRYMRLAMAAVVVAVAALRHQNADNDEDVALLLQRAAADRLDMAIEKVEAALAGLPR